MRKCDSIPFTEGTSWTWRLAVTTGAETPRFLILGFQSGDRSEQTANPSIFNHCNVDNIQIQMLGRLYPLQAEVLTFTDKDYSLAYGNASDFRSLMDGTPEMFSHLGINPSDFKTLYPLSVSDLSKQIAKLRSGVVDINIRVKFRENPAANTTAYALFQIKYLT